MVCCIFSPFTWNIYFAVSILPLAWTRLTLSTYVYIIISFTFFSSVTSFSSYPVFTHRTCVFININRACFWLPVHKLRFTDPLTLTCHRRPLVFDCVLGQTFTGHHLGLFVGLKISFCWVKENKAYVPLQCFQLNLLMLSIHITLHVLLSCGMLFHKKTLQLIDPKWLIKTTKLTVT